MTKVEELKQELNALKEEVRGLLKENKVTDAEGKMEEVRNLKSKIKMQEELDKEEERKLENKLNDPKVDPKTEKTTYRSAFSKFVRREQLTEEERKLLKAEVRQMNEGIKADGGYLVPTEDDTKIIKLREASDALQNYITVVPVTTPAGQKTIRLRKSGGSNFEEVGEGKKINTKKGPAYKKLEYNCKKYAAIYDITDELLDDADENVMSEMTEWIGNDSRENRNVLVLNELNKKKAVAITNADDIKAILNKKLSVENAKYSSILTNQDGFHFLDTLKDDKGNYLLQPVVGDATRYKFTGKDVIVIDNTVLPSKLDKAPIFIGDLKMACVMFDRKKVTVKITQEGGDAFNNDLTLMRAIEREDIQTLDDQAFIKGEVSLTSVATGN